MTQLALALPPIAGEPCPDCAAAQRRMKDEGFRDWRDHACFTHAALDLDEYLAAKAALSDPKDATHV